MCVCDGEREKFCVCVCGDCSRAVVLCEGVQLNGQEGDSHTCLPKGLFQSASECVTVTLSELLSS